MTAPTSSSGGLVPAHEVVERGLAGAGADACIVIVEERSQAEVRFANNGATTNGTRRDRRVTVAAVRRSNAGMAVGVASQSGAVDVRELVERAEADASEASPAEDASPLLLPEEVGVGAEFTSPPPMTGLGGLGDVLSGLGGAFERARAAQYVLAGFAEHELSTVYLGTSTGVRMRHVQPTGKLELAARADGGARTAWAGAGAADLSSVRFESLEERLTQRLEWSRRRVELDAGHYEVVLPPDAVADLMILAGESMSGREAEEGRSVFSAPGGRTRLGEKLADIPFTLRSDPAEPGLECTPFLVATASGEDTSVFDNGLPIVGTDWIAGGCLERLAYHRAGAAKAGTSPAVMADNLLLEVPGATASVEDLVAHSDRALLLTCLWYIRTVDPSTLLLTGLTRDGVFLVEHGEIVGAVNNFRFNESPIDVLGRVVEAGKTERALSREWNEWLNRTAMPSLRVAEFNMSSVSPAT
jgi:predicted Zn-dependent protease